jgi:hypothetical protein
MASDTHISITLTPAQRDAVREEVESICNLGTDLVLYLEGAPSDPTSAKWIADWTRQAAAGARLLEQLGWEERGERRSYELDVDQGVADFMQLVCERTLGTLQDDCRDLGTPFGWTGPEADESMVRHRHQINLDLDLLEVTRIARSAFTEGAVA